MKKTGTLGVMLPALALVGLPGCKKLFSSSNSEPAPQASAAPSSSARSPAAQVVIPQGTLLAGSACQAIPRITTEELPAIAMALGEFRIDAYPYPNDPAKAPVTNVARDEASQMCAERGERLCTELEWERACKGGANQEYEYGNTYNAAACAQVSPGDAEGAMGQRPTCTSTFGVHDMHGLVWEWTDSSWGRGTSGGLVAVRGGFGQNAELVSRCANGQGHAPLEKNPTIGFRCCSGPKNTADVNIADPKQAPLVQEPSVDATLNKRLLNALPRDLRAAPTATISFDQIWRWHPRPNEEILIARYLAQPKSGGSASFREMAFKLCGNATQLLAEPHGQVDHADNPATGAEPQRASVHVTLGKNQGDVHFYYLYGRVGVEQPGFLATHAAGADGGALSSDAGSAMTATSSASSDAGAAAATPLRSGRRIAH